MHPRTLGPGARRRAPSAVAAALAVALAACGDKPAASPPAATVANQRSEADLSTITLTPDAERRLAIVVAEVERRTVPLVRVLGGELMVSPGRDVTVSAPRAGTVQVPPGQPAPVPGAMVRRGQPLMRLIALPPEADLFRAREDLTTAEARASAARLRAQRAQELFQARLGTAEANESAQAELTAAEGTLRTARSRVDLLSGVSTAADSGSLEALTITSPDDGVIDHLYVAPGQTVAAGAALFMVETVDPLWVRVPVYVGDLAAVDRARSVMVGAPGDPAYAARRPARPVAGPPVADAVAASVDLFYELANPGHTLLPKQRVSVVVPLRSSTEGLVVPWSAVVHDVHGGTWVYERVRPQVYVRRRVDVRHVVGDLAVLARGPAPGAEVVVTGVAELFGTEFGAGK